MDKTKIILIILMGLVTYIPRALPSILLEKIKIEGRVEKFLKLIPYTAMASLIFPGVFTADENSYVIGIVGAAVAGILAYFKCPVIVCVVSAIAVDFLIYLAI